MRHGGKIRGAAPWAAGILFILTAGFIFASSETASRPRIYAANLLGVELSNPVVWLSADKIAFAGSLRAANGVRNDSLYLWEITSKPVEVYSGTSGEIVEIIPLTTSSGVFQSTGPGPKFTKSYFRFDSSSAVAITAGEYLPYWNINLENRHAAPESLRKRAAETVNLATDSKNFEWFQAELAADRTRAVLYKDVAYTGNGRPPERSEWEDWAKTNCRPFYSFEFATNQVAKHCLPYGGWSEVIVTPVVAARETFFAGYAGNWASWSPEYFGIYRNTGTNLQNLYPKKHIKPPLLSPDGCKVAVVGRDTKADAPVNVSNDNSTLEVLDLCFLREGREGDQSLQ